MRIDQIGKVVGGGTPSTKRSEYFGGNIPWITPKDLSTFSDRHIVQGERSITEEGLRASSAKLIPENSVIISSRAPVGLVALAGQSLATNQGCRSIVPNERVNPLFVYYLLKANTDYLRQNSGGSTFQEISGSTLSGLEFEFPSIDEQRRIAHILGTLDDKIELNRQMNTTLDEIARTLFRSWFVDFDPVRAKMEGRQPDGMDAATAALFPDRLVDSELGPIPEGWEVKAFTELVDVVGGGTPKTGNSEYWGGTIPWFAMADLPKDGSPFVTKTAKSITEAGERNSSAKRVSEGTTILTARGTVGEVVIAGEDMSFNQSCYALRPLDSSIGALGVHLLTRSLVSLLKTRTHGSVFQTITRTTLGSLEVVDPGVEVWDSFENVIGSMFALLKNNANESQTLSELRDTLLPQLLDGDK